MSARDPEQVAGAIAVQVRRGSDEPKGLPVISQTAQAVCFVLVVFPEDGGPGGVPDGRPGPTVAADDGLGAQLDHVGLAGRQLDRHRDRGEGERLLSGFFLVAHPRNRLPSQQAAFFQRERSAFAPRPD